MILKSAESRIALVPTLAAALLCGGFTALLLRSHSPLAVTFAGLAVVTLALPPLIVASRRWRDHALITAAAVLSVTAVWLAQDISWSQWLACSAVMISYALALTGVVSLLTRCGIHSTASAAIVVVVSLVWLTWPIWLSNWLAGHETLVSWLVFAHPPLALNGVLIDQGIWTERPHMYGWTALNQDVSYSLPVTVFWCVTLHAGIGCGAIALCWLLGRRPKHATL